MNVSRTSLVEISTTLPSLDDAEQLANLAVSRRLAACVQVSSPVLSVYRWKGEVQREQEFALRMKTSLECRDRLIELVESNHPYELPELIVHVVEASAKYSQWVCEQTNVGADVPPLGL